MPLKLSVQSQPAWRTLLRCHAASVHCPVQLSTDGRCVALSVQAAGLITAVVVISAAAFTTHAVRYQGFGAAPHPPLVYAVMLLFLLLPIKFVFPVSACPAPLTAWLPASQTPMPPCLPFKACMLSAQMH